MTRLLHKARPVRITFIVNTNAPMNILSDRLVIECGLAESLMESNLDDIPICEVSSVKAKQIPPHKLERRRR